MNTFGLYLIYFLALTLTYRLLVSRTGNFTLNRFILLSFPLISLFFATFKWKSESPALLLYLPELNVQIEQAVSAIPSESINYLSWIYYGGATLFSILFIKNLVLILLKNNSSSGFSFFGKIKLNGNLNPETKEVIQIHERVHAQKWHSIDVVFAELVQIFTWFNPLNRLWKKEIKLNHEFEADFHTSRQYEKYATLLVSQHLNVDHNVLGNHFSMSNLKNRLTMMNSKKQKNNGLRYASLIGIACLTTALISWSPTKVSEPKEVVSTQTTEDTMPEFPGGMEAMLAFLSENIKYPEKAKTEKIEGKTYIGFTVDKDGNINDTEIKRSAHELLDAEAIRVIQLMPKWTPGTKDGKPANVEMVIPIVFKL